MLYLRLTAATAALTRRQQWWGCLIAAERWADQGWKAAAFERREDVAARDGRAKDLFF